MIEKLKTSMEDEEIDMSSGAVNQMWEDTPLVRKINELVDAVNELQKQVKKMGQIINFKQPDAKEIPDTEYITINEDGCFVGGVSTTKYNGKDIYRPYMCVAQFKEARDIIREEYDFDLLELHCLQSSTKDEYANTGYPVPDKNGIYAWARAVYRNKKGKTVSSLWAFDGSHSDCAWYCAYYCANSVRYGSGLRSGLFGSVAPNDVNERDE